MDADKTYPVRCEKCGQVLAMRENNQIASIMRHRNRKKEIHIRLRKDQVMTILCDHCGSINKIIGN
jgi:ribosomal protein S27E